MKITQTKLKQLIQEELDAVAAEGMYDVEALPRMHNGKTITVNGVVKELMNLVFKIEALGEEFFSDSKDLEYWVGTFMEKHKLLQNSDAGAIEENYKDRTKKPSAREKGCVENGVYWNDRLGWVCSQKKKWD